MNYSWSAKSPDVEKAQFLSSELKISHFLSKLLINRNIDSYEEAHQFLHPYLEKNDGSLNLPDPFLLKGMEDGVQRIIRAIESSENIAIDQKLIDEGTAQLASEIKVLEAWLEELETSDDRDAEVVAARKSYKDMLRSRKEMLNTLENQAKLQAI